MSMKFEQLIRGAKRAFYQTDSLEAKDRICEYLANYSCVDLYLLGSLEMTPEGIDKSINVCYDYIVEKENGGKEKTYHIEF